MEHIFYLTIKVKTYSSLALDEAMTEFQENTDYNFNNTDSVIVTDTEIIEISTEPNLLIIKH